jgi:polysaccharide export outer membrane protein
MLKNIYQFKGLRIMLLISALILAFTSCSTSKRKLVYVNKVETGEVYTNNSTPETYLIKPFDHLYIVVMGDDPLNTAYLNLTTAVANSAGSNLELITYTVDEHGNISFPQLGELAVEGKTVLEIQTDLQERIGEYIKNTSVYVKLVDRTITVLGEVLSPGNLVVFKSQLTIFEAIGTAGDLTDWGNRKDVKVFRKTDEGTEVASLDLTDPDLLYSEYYYIFPNDVIYVEPRSRVFGFKTLDFSSIFTMTLAVVTTGLLIVTFIER